MGLGIGEALAVAAQQGQMLMAVERRPRPLFRGRRSEIDADGQLHDRAVGQLPDHAFPEELMLGPQIAEASAALEKHGSARRQPALERRPGIRELIGHEGDATAEIAEGGDRAQPDRGVANVRVAGEVEERRGPARRNDAREHGVEVGPEIRHRRWSPAHRGIRLGHGPWESRGTNRGNRPGRGPAPLRRGSTGTSTWTVAPCWCHGRLPAPASGRI
jgi:hypothetical protein